MRIESQTAASQDVLQSIETGTASGRQVLLTSEPDGSSTGQTRSDTVRISKEPSLATMQNQKPIDVKEAVEKLNKYVQSQKKYVNFSIDEETNTTVIKVFKSETGELIRQFPPEEILSMAARIRQSIGWMFDARV